MTIKRSVETLDVINKLIAFYLFDDDKTYVWEECANELKVLTINTKAEVYTDELYHLGYNVQHSRTKFLLIKITSIITDDIKQQLGL